MSEDTLVPPIPGLVIRPPGPFLDLPLEWRWEATRRHPYYLHFWSWALRCYVRPNDVAPAEQAFAELALAVVQSLGVSAPPVDPAANFADLFGQDVDPAFLSGSCLPIPLRDYISELIQQLSPTELALLGHLCRVATRADYRIEGDDEFLSQQRMQALLGLDRAVGGNLESYGRRPVFRINPGAAETTVTSDIKVQLRRFRAHFGLPNRRIHTKKLRDYFAVWDLREGWIGSQYDSSVERQFLEIAARRKKPLETVVSQYKSAFKLVTGHDYSPRLWARVFLLPRIHPVFIEPRAESPATVRKTEDRVRRPIPQSVLGEHGEKILETESAVESETMWSDLLVDLDRLIDEGRTDEAIAEVISESYLFEIEPRNIAYYRSRRDEISRIRPGRRGRPSDSD